MKKIYIILLSLALNSYGQTSGNGVTDIDGTFYNTVIIGTQEWTKENLNVSKYSDGTPIPQVTDPTAWANLTTGAWCYYNNDFANGTVYGKLYNWYAVAGIYDVASLTNSALRKKLAPTGYHPPTDTEWTTFTTFLGGLSISAGKMKETGTTHWLSPNSYATNSSGFTGLPGGFRYINGDFQNIGYYGIWWSTSENTTSNAWYRSLSYYYNNAYCNYVSKNVGCSVRFVKDSPLSTTTAGNINKILIFSNPTQSILNISINEGVVLDKITIVDINGKLVLEQTENLSIINVEKLAKGVYILTAYAGDKKYQEKFIKE